MSAGDTRLNHILNIGTLARRLKRRFLPDMGQLINIKLVGELKGFLGSRHFIYRTHFGEPAFMAKLADADVKFPFFILYLPNLLILPYLMEHRSCGVFCRFARRQC